MIAGNKQNGDTASLESLNEKCKVYLGKYRGTVYNNIDPKSEGRVQVVVPAVQATPLLHWATLCTPIGGLQNGIFAVPPIGTGVWIEFEAGDIDYPICTGCFWGSGAEVPNLGKNVQKPGINSLAIQTLTQSGITISDTPVGDDGGIQIRTISGARISITQGQIKIDNGLGASIKMIGPTIAIDASTVMINKTSLVVT